MDDKTLQNLWSRADGQVWLLNSKTGQHVERHFVDEFSEWVSNMRALLERLHGDAIASMRSNPALQGNAPLSWPFGDLTL